MNQKLKCNYTPLVFYHATNQPLSHEGVVLRGVFFPLHDKIWKKYVSWSEKFEKIYGKIRFKK